MKYLLSLLLLLPVCIRAQRCPPAGTAVRQMDTLPALKEDTLSEVVVSGTSRPVRIRENPVAISSVPAKVIDRTISSNIIDVLVQNTPGLHSVKTGPNISKPFIRGLGYNR